MSLTIGERATRTKTITDSDIRGFADVIEDHNPIHLDENYAATSRFGQRVAHGMLIASLISGVLAHDLPGEGVIYMGQSVKFKKPVFIGDTVTVIVTVTNYRTDRRIATLSTVITNQREEVVVEGEATVMLPA